MLATFWHIVDTVLNRNKMVEEEKTLKDPIVGDFVVEKQAIAGSQIHATLYPKFENEKFDQEVSLLVSLQFVLFKQV